MNGGSITGNTAGNTAKEGGGIYSNGTIILVDGSIDHNGSSYGGGINVNSGTLTMNGGSISDNQVLSGQPYSGTFRRGGGLFIKGTFTMNGGIIQNNSAEGGGGGIYCEVATLTLTKGTISGNSGSYGGAVYTDRTTFSMGSECTISNNSAKIVGGTSNHGGGIYVDKSSTFTMDGGIVESNEADAGGGIYVAGEATCTIKTGCIIRNNDAISGGGVCGSSLNGGSTIIMSGGSITGNTSTGGLVGGGGIVCENGCQFTMSAGTIANNTATGIVGGGVSVRNGAKFTMSGGSIDHNTTIQKGGGVYIVWEGQFEMSGGMIQENFAASEGGGVYLEVSPAANFIMYDNPVITNNTANGIDNNVFLSKGLTTEGKKAITIPSALGDDADVGITVDGYDLPTVEDPVNKWDLDEHNTKFGERSGTYIITESDKSKFMSDVPGYVIVLNSDNTRLLIRKHEHTLIYSDNGAAMITARCVNEYGGCPLAESRSDLTIIAPAKTDTTDDKSQYATFDGLKLFNEVTRKGVKTDHIKYYPATKTGTDYAIAGGALAAAPTTAGIYIAELVLENVKTEPSFGTGIEVLGDVRAFVGYTITGPVSYTVTFKVVNGAWNDDTTGDQTVTLNGTTGDSLTLAAGQIPEVGEKPAAGYQEGAWDTVPATDTVITADTTYTYTYAATATYTVTFKVVNGFWDDNSSADKIVTISNAGGAELKLTDAQIPLGIYLIRKKK